MSQNPTTREVIDTIDGALRQYLESAAAAEAAVNVWSALYRAGHLKETTATVTAPRWALEFIMKHAGFEDESSFSGSSWQSDKMSKAENAILAALKEHQS